MSVPPYLWVFIAYSVVALISALTVGAFAALMSAGASTQEARSTAVVIGGFLTAWAAGAALLAPHSVFIPPQIFALRAAAGVGAAIVFCVMLLATPFGKRLMDAAPISWLTGLQVYRGLMGSVFLILCGLHLMPAVFALPAGFGDVLVAVCAIPLAALNAGRHPWSSGLTRLWCAFGILDLVNAAGLAVATSPGLQLIPTDPANALIVQYPLVLLPLFLVPLSVVLDVLVLSRLSRAPRLDLHGLGAAA